MSETRRRGARRLGPRHWTLGLALAVALGTAADQAVAQERTRGPDPERRLERLTQMLELTEDQAAQVGGILAERDAKRKAMWEEQREIREQTRQQARDRMEALHQETEGRLGGVLSEEQMEKYRAHVQQMRERMERRWDRGGRRGPPGSRR